jgi:molybdopterin-guanine dinucleotide biosynthesis protein MobB
MIMPRAHALLSSRPPVVGIRGPSGSGKTLLIERLVPRLRARGLRVAVVKHCSHRLDVDHPGKDSDRIFRAGADVIAAGPGEALLRIHADHMTLDECLRRLPGDCDVVLVEGFRDMPFPQVRLKGPFRNAALVRKQVEALCDAAEEIVQREVERARRAGESALPNRLRRR